MLTSSAVELAFDPVIASLRHREFARLDRTQLAYLDYTGSALYGESQLRAHHALLAEGVFGNPHSENDPSRASGDLIAQVKADVLRFFDADPDRYAVCFTANTSAAIKLVAESYPFNPHATLALAVDNHNSVNGVREYARRAGAHVAYLPLDAELRLDDPTSRLASLASSTPLGRGARLFAFPAQSNFSGVKHPLTLIHDAHRLGFDVLLDAAAFAPSNLLSLRDWPAEFVAVSFYKIFGYPTGLGALIARRDKLTALRRPWFAGGTVDFASVQNGIHQLRDSIEGFEDGTPDFLNIAALRPGFALIANVGPQRIAAHVAALTGSLLAGLAELTHANGEPLVRIYGPRNMSDRGGTVAFNVMSPSGRVLPYSLVERRARDAGVAVRGGCFCNPGAAESAFGFDAAKTRACMAAASRAGFTIERFAACLADDTAVGAVRASIGIANNAADVQAALSVIQSFADN